MLSCFRQLNLEIIIFRKFILHNDTRSPDFQISVVRIHDDVHIFIRTETTTDHTAKNLLQYGDDCRSIDIFKLFKLLKRVYQIDVAVAHYSFKMKLPLLLLLSGQKEALSPPLVLFCL